MSQPQVIIVTGLPGTGKTSLAQRLSQDLALPFIYKDGIKERLFDTLGWGEVDWSAKLSEASRDLLFYFAESQLQAGQSFIIECNFKPEIDGPRFKELGQLYDFMPVQIHLLGDGKVLLKRVLERASAGNRHPGHMEQAQLAYFQAILAKGRAGLLELPGPVIEVDTTDFENIRYDEILTELRAFIK